MKQHKWHKEIKAWADGAEIEARNIFKNDQIKTKSDWYNIEEPQWDISGFYEYRIKPQLKEEKYWLCCGSLNYQQHHRTCCEAKVGHKERCRFGTAKEHFDWSNSIEPKEPKYLYAYKDYVRDDGSTTSKITISSTFLDTEFYIGKIKLEVEE
jgi:hypothetical protein